MKAGSISFGAIALFAYLSAFGYLPGLPRATAPQQQNEAQGPQNEGNSPQQPGSPTRITVEGAVTVVDQANPDEQAAHTEEQSNRRYEIRIGFITLIFAAIAAFFTYRAYRETKRQADAAASQTQIMKASFEDEQRRLNETMRPRLDIESVRMSEVSPPVFFVKVANRGPVDANDVLISIEAEYMGQSGVSYNDGPHQLNIPANSYREHFIASGFTFNDEMREQVERKDAPLIVKGTVRHDDSKYSKEYCYKWNPWPHPEHRPDGLPFFVPCEFRKGKTHRIRVGGAITPTGTVHTPTVNQEFRANADASFDATVKKLREPH